MTVEKVFHIIIVLQLERKSTKSSYYINKDVSFHKKIIPKNSGHRF